MAGGSSKRVEAETSSNTSATLRRAKDCSAFARCEGCNKNVAAALISMHNCSLDAKITDNLEAQVVETQTEAKKKSAEKKKLTSDEPKPKRVRKPKDAKKSSSTSKKPNRPLTAFHIFMNDFRKKYKRENPYINVKDVAKKGAEKWKSLTEEDKKVYLDEAAELQADYNKSLENNNVMRNQMMLMNYDAEEKQADDSDEAEKKVKKKKRIWMTTRHVFLVLGGLVILKWISSDALYIKPLLS